MNTRTIQINGVEFPNEGEAIQHSEASGFGRAILVGGKYIVVEAAEAHRLETAGVAFAYLNIVEHADHPDGLVITVPVN